MDDLVLRMDYKRFTCKIRQLRFRVFIPIDFRNCVEDNVHHTCY